MKQIILFLGILSALGNAVTAQVIKKIDCIKMREDSSTTKYSVKVSFDSFGTKENCLQLVKMELEKKYQITADRIISIETFRGKRYRTYLYGVVVKKD